jgi:pantoate--beta-alanine ligase
MEIIRDIGAMQGVALAAGRSGRRIGLVPTMGFLHEGHLSLVRLARTRCDVLVVSLFVNPTQFGPAEDLDDYPRDFARDSRLCEAERVDVLFCPDSAAVYPPGYSTYVRETVLSKPLCGASRPDHFRGVATVVAKLFNIVRPDVAVFGRKDAQQCRVIERLVADLNMPVELLMGPIVREPDGLAMSSRNRYLSATERQDAVCLYHAVRKAETLYGDGERNAAKILEAMNATLAAVPTAQVEYAEVVDYDTLRPVSRIDRPTLVAVAVRIGTARLIDNVILGG